MTGTVEGEAAQSGDARRGLTEADFVALGRCCAGSEAVSARYPAAGPQAGRLSHWSGVLTIRVIPEPSLRIV